MQNVKRCPVRFRDADCPDEVADIFDNPQFGDRYTVFLRKVYEYHGQKFVFYRGMSEAPSSPQGVGLSGEMSPWELSRYRDSNRRKRVAWSTLPEKVKACVRQDIGEEG